MLNNYMVVAKLTSEMPEYKVALFLHVDADALKIFNGYQFVEPAHKNDLDKIMEKFDRFAISKLNETFQEIHFQLTRLNQGRKC